jgi:hypothetical protein
MTEQVVARLHAGPAAEPDHVSPSRWRLRTIRAAVPVWMDLTLSGTWRALQQLGIELRSARVQQYSPDPEYAAKVDHLLACLEEAASAPGAIEALFLDEMGYTRWPEPATDWTARAPAAAPLADRAQSKQQLWRVVGALNARTGQVDVLENYIVGREQLNAFYRQLDRRYPTARKLYIVQDNWSIHRHADVLATLATLPRIEPVWLPTYAPWLNPIEKLWRWLKGDVLMQHRLAADWPALRQRVAAFFAQFAEGSADLLRYVGLTGSGLLARACRAA